MLPAKVHGHPVKFVAHIDPPRFPRGYPGDGNLEKTAAFLISVSDEASEDERRFWVHCLGSNGQMMAGEMCYTLEAAMNFPTSEFDVDHLSWHPLP